MLAPNAPSSEPFTAFTAPDNSMIRRCEGRKRFRRRIEQLLEAMILWEAVPLGCKTDMAYYLRTRDMSYVRNVYEI